VPTFVEKLDDALFCALLSIVRDLVGGNGLEPMTSAMIPTLTIAEQLPYIIQNELVCDFWNGQ
jgi:hypothetical protein